MTIELRGLIFGKKSVHCKSRPEDGASPKLDVSLASESSAPFRLFLPVFGSGIGLSRMVKVQPPPPSFSESFSVSAFASSGFLSGLGFESSSTLLTPVAMSSSSASKSLFGAHSSERRNRRCFSENMDMLSRMTPRKSRRKGRK